MNLDKKHLYSYYDDRIKIAKSLGFDSITEAIIKTYRKNQSTEKTGKIFEFSPTAIAYILKKFNEPMRGPGGANRGNNIPELFKQSTYDHDRYKLGPLCNQKHEWNNTGKSLRHNAGYCIMCQHIKNKIRYEETRNGSSRLSQAAIPK